MIRNKHGRKTIGKFELSPVPAAAKDLRLMWIDAYGFSAERVEEIGRMVGADGLSIHGF